MSVSSGSIYSRPALCLKYVNQGLFLENSLGLLLLKQWLPFQLLLPHWETRFIAKWLWGHKGCVQQGLCFPWWSLCLVDRGVVWFVFRRQERAPSLAGWVLSSLRPGLQGEAQAYGSLFSLIVIKALESFRIN